MLDIEKVLKHYIVAALWSSNDESTPEGGELLDKNFDESDIDEGTLEKMREDVTRFVNENHKALSTWSGEQTMIEEQAGHDFWFDRNGHGVGFWEPEWGDVGEQLSKSATKFGEVFLFVNDDGKIYCD
jgi:hypothetical protein